MTRCLLLTVLIAALSVVATATAELVVYEEFDYPAGLVDGTQSGGTGMSEAWTTSSTDGGILYSMVFGALTFTNLPTAGSVCAKRNTAPRGAEHARTSRKERGHRENAQCDFYSD